MGWSFKRGMLAFYLRGLLFQVSNAFIAMKQDSLSEPLTHWPFHWSVGFYFASGPKCADRDTVITFAPWKFGAKLHDLKCTTIKMNFNLCHNTDECGIKPCQKPKTMHPESPRCSPPMPSHHYLSNIADFISTWYLGSLPSPPPPAKSIMISYRGHPTTFHHWVCTGDYQYQEPGNLLSHACFLLRVFHSSLTSAWMHKYRCSSRDWH